MLKNLIKTSIFARLLGKIRIICLAIEPRLLNMYNNSRCNRLIQVFWERAKVLFKYSFLGRLTEVKTEENYLILNESRLFMYILNVYKKYKNKARVYLITSRNYILLGQIQGRLHSFSLRAIGIILVAAVFTNTIFSLLFGQEIELAGWIMRGLLLFAGSAGLFSNANWPTVKENSLILSILFKKCAGFAER